MKRRGEVWLVWVEGERETRNEKKRGREDDRKQRQKGSEEGGG